MKFTSGQSAKFDALDEKLNKAEFDQNKLWRKIDMQNEKFERRLAQ